VKEGGPASDHDPIVLKLQFKQKRRGIAPPKMETTRITWDRLDDQETATEFKELAMANIKNLTSEEISSAKDFSKKAIVEAAEQICAEDAIIKKGWFTKGLEVLEPLIKTRKMASKQQQLSPSEANAEIFRALRALLNREVQKAKNRLEYKKLVKIMDTIQTRPCKAWKKMRSLQAGHNLHHAA
jgi:hypothetical protein